MFPELLGQGADLFDGRGLELFLDGRDGGFKLLNVLQRAGPGLEGVSEFFGGKSAPPPTTSS